MHVQSTFYRVCPRTQRGEGRCTGPTAAWPEAVLVPAHYPIPPPRVPSIAVRGQGDEDMPPRSQTQLPRRRHPQAETRTTLVPAFPGHWPPGAPALQPLLPPPGPVPLHSPCCSPPGLVPLRSPCCPRLALARSTAPVAPRLALTCSTAPVAPAWPWPPLQPLLPAISPAQEQGGCFSSGLFQSLQFYNF